ncbi:MAG: hypothetical protein HUU43_02935 [Ignavibacteriaceae bacterium]|nr:LiaF-related protein [Ignavibacteriaceae bacterium]NUM69778.1 hypothetical protein [Ignavibacteriaceae bacterium]
MANNNSMKARLVLGVILITAGILVFLENNEIVHWNLIGLLFSFKTWLILIGVVILVNSRRKLVGAAFVLIGSLWYVSDIFRFDFSELFFPVLLLIAGIAIIFKQNKNNGQGTDYRKKGVLHKDVIDEVAIFGGGERKFESDDFRGGNLTAIFGGLEIDLRGCKLSENNNMLDIFVLFGGVDIKIPADWKVQSDVMPIFGGFSTKHVTFENPRIIESGGKVLNIKGVVLFGGGEVKVF